MAKGDDLFGEGVNVAARLEGLAEPGGFCVSGSVFEQVKHKLSLSFEDIGPQQVKNVAETIAAAIAAVRHLGAALVFAIASAPSATESGVSMAR